MLTLRRKIGESVLYEMPDGRVIRLVILGIDGARTVLGIDAPADVSIRRGEAIEVDNRTEG